MEFILFLLSVFVDLRGVVSSSVHGGVGVNDVVAHLCHTERSAVGHDVTGTPTLLLLAHIVNLSRRREIVSPKKRMERGKRGHVQHRRRYPSRPPLRSVHCLSFMSWCATSATESDLPQWRRWQGPNLRCACTRTSFVSRKSTTSEITPQYFILSYHNSHDVDGKESPLFLVENRNNKNMSSK